MGQNKRKKAFTLAETLISILLIGCVLTLILSGFRISNLLQSQAAFESEASYLAEREMEFIKAELHAGMIKPFTGNLPARFKLDAGWAVNTELIKDKELNDIELIVKVNKGNDVMVLDSFFYAPSSLTGGENNEQ